MYKLRLEPNKKICSHRYSIYYWGIYAEKGIGLLERRECHVVVVPTVTGRVTQGHLKCWGGAITQDLPVRRGSVGPAGCAGSSDHCAHTTALPPHKELSLWRALHHRQQPLWGRSPKCTHTKVIRHECRHLGNLFCFEFVLVCALKKGGGGQ